MSNQKDKGHRNIKEMKKKDAPTDLYKNNRPSSDVKRVPFAVVESYKSIRANLMFQLGKENGRVIAFSSPNAGEGKSTTAVNIAIAFSQLGDKVLLIDADMRRSSVHKKLRIENEKGLSNVLAKLDTFEDSVVSVNDYLDVLTAGKTPPNPSELIGNKNFDALIDNAKPIYSIIIIDTPPIGVVSDALLIAPRTDGLILVVRDGYTPHDTIKHTLGAIELAEIKILGAIMNGANPKNNKKYSYRKYSYGTRGYYSNKRNYGRGSYGYGYGYGQNGYGYGYGANAYGYGASPDDIDDKEIKSNSKENHE